MAHQGFIKLHRKIQEHWIYQEKRTFSKYEAWLDLIFMANHKDNEFLLGKELISTKRGQLITSKKTLGERWKWSNTKINSFFRLLKNEKMIDYKTDSKKTVVTLDKYSIYHDYENEETAKNHINNIPKTHQKHTNKNVKNVKNLNTLKDIVEITTHLNDAAQTNYRPSSKKTKQLIKARLNDGFTFDDFKNVIDIKTAEWVNDKEMSKYLRPETLFGTKFESYLNQKTETANESTHTPPDLFDPSVLLED